MRSYEADSNPLFNELQALDYALVELTLHLATHPFDENAIIQHNELAEKRHATRDELEHHNRQEGNSEAEDSSSWRLNLTPWPWNV